MRKCWRYFRVQGDPPEFAGDNLITIAINHGGRFYSNGGRDKEYKNGEIVYIDDVDPDKMAMTEINTWAYDLGYCSGPIGFWYKISSSKSGTGYVPINKDSQVVRMLELAPSEGTLNLYIVCLGERKSLEELEAEGAAVVNHSKYFGHTIEDLPLTVAQVVSEKEIEKEVPGLVEKEVAGLVEKEGRVEDVGDEGHPRDILNDEELMEQTFGASYRVEDDADVGDEGFELKKRGASRTVSDFID